MKKKFEVTSARVNRKSDAPVYVPYTELTRRMMETVPSGGTRKWLMNVAHEMTFVQSDPLKNCEGPASIRVEAFMRCIMAGRPSARGVALNVLKGVNKFVWT